MMRFCLYIIDDEPSIRQSLSVALKKEYDIKTFATAEEALKALTAHNPDLILLDIGLPDMSGTEALRHIKARAPDVIVIMITAYEDLDTVIAAMKGGAYDYIVKPINLKGIRNNIHNALETIILRKEIQSLQEHYLKENLPCFIAQSDKIQDTMQIVTRVAHSPDTPVLILGETGTGKELIARAIHYKSPRFQGPFVALNCAAIPRDLLESELFGYERGAFSGAATSGKTGLVEEAAEGTLFLDEVAELGLEAQAKLLKFLDSGEYYRLGSTKKHLAKTRVVSATNKDLDALRAAGQFRDDLYYRLAVFKIEVPSLNERRNDIIPIAQFFLVELSRKYGKTFQGLTPEAETQLINHSWQGNVRELRNTIERGVLLEDGPLLALADASIQTILQPPHPHPDNGATCFPALPPEGLDLSALENHYIQEAIKISGGNDRLAAKLLKMSYYAFRYKKNKRQDE